MPIIYLRKLTGKERTQNANRHLACFLAFIAGAVNAGGFLAIQQYTSHMSGIVSSMADNSALGNSMPVFVGLASLVSFLTGAACSAILINHGRRHHLHSEYAAPLAIEALLLILFGFLGSPHTHQGPSLISLTMVLLCFIMGLQNAMITKISKAEIRTTHVTGLITDIGIELGKLIYWNGKKTNTGQHFVRADRKKLLLLSLLVGLFFTGGITGALGFSHIGFSATLPLAALLLLLAVIPVFDDVREKIAKNIKQ